MTRNRFGIAVLLLAITLFLGIPISWLTTTAAPINSWLAISPLTYIKTDNLPAALQSLVRNTSNPLPTDSKQLALVVGINEYKHAKAAHLKTLQGAVNDARLLAESLRALGVNLPDSRILINEQATVEHFKTAWEDLLKQARPGDRIILTFAGHGGQELEFAPPYDEKDIAVGKEHGKDETLMFYDFDPEHPYRGRLSDDELYSLLEKASAYPITIVADSCHSGGLTRAVFSTTVLPDRGSVDDYEPNPPPGDYVAPTSADNEALEHVTFLSGTESEALQIREILAPDGKPHGALSWVFAEAIHGKADQNNDTLVSRREMEAYVKEQVALLSDRTQHPGFLPRGNETSAISLKNKSSTATLATSSILSDIPIIIEGGTIPPGTDYIRTVDTGWRLLFKHDKGQVAVFNPGGDKLTEFDESDTTAWNRLIAKYRLIAALDSAYNINAAPVRITLQQGDGLHHLGERLDFKFTSGAEQRYFLLFDLAGNGELQFLYPIQARNDPPLLPEITYTLPVDVQPPIGEDDVVAVFCSRPQNAAIALLEQHSGKTPPTPETLVKAISEDCQIGRYSFFTAQ